MLYSSSMRKSQPGMREAAMSRLRWTAQRSCVSVTAIYAPRDIPTTLAFSRDPIMNAAVAVQPPTRYTLTRADIRAG